MALSVRSGSSMSTSSSSSSLSSLYSKGARPRSLPRRGQIKGAIFASFFASFAQLLGAKPPENAANSQDEGGSRGSPARMSDFRMDVEGGLSADDGEGFGLSVRSSTVSNCSGTVTPDSSFFKPLSRPPSFYGGMNGKG